VSAGGLDSEVAADTSAERSAAREDDVGPSATFRVASPLVMATRGRKVRFSRAHSGAFCVLESYTTTLLLRRTVVPHETMSDARINCLGFAALRLRQRPTASPPVASAHCSCGRRCGGSLWRESRESEQVAKRVVHAKASESEASRERSLFLRSPLRRLPLARITRKRASCEAGCERSNTRSRLRALKHDLISARGDSLAARLTKASERGHLKRSFSSPLVASARVQSP
jgi:hypothetical protein